MRSLFIHVLVNVQLKTKTLFILKQFWYSQAIFQNVSRCCCFCKKIEKCVSLFTSAPIDKQYFFKKKKKVNWRNRCFLVPSKPVITLKARNTSHTSLLVEWTDIPRDFVHGILLGFRVLFWRSNESRDTYETGEVASDQSSLHLKDLWIYTKYKIQILGFTAAGEGAVSQEIEVSTDEFSKFFPISSLVKKQELSLDY